MGSEACKCECPDQGRQEDHLKPTYPTSTSFVRRHDEKGKIGDTPQDTDGDSMGQHAQFAVPAPGYETKDSSRGPNAAHQMQTSPDTTKAPINLNNSDTPRMGSETPRMGSETPRDRTGTAYSPRDANQSPPARSAADWAKDQEQFAHLPKLVDGWIRVRSRTTGAIYYCYVETGETTLNEPTGPPPSKCKGNDLPPGWVQTQSRTTGRIYYWNSQLSRSQYERPTAAHSDGDAGNEDLPVGWCSKQSRSTGRTYYYNSVLQKSQFEKPTSAEG